MSALDHSRLVNLSGGSDGGGGGRDKMVIEDQCISLTVTGHDLEQDCGKTTPIKCMVHITAYMELPADDKFMECL